MELKIKKDLQNGEYHKKDGHLSSSVIKIALNGTQAYSNYLKDDQENPETDDFKFGTAAHTMVLENEKFDHDYMIMDTGERPEPEKDFRSSKNKEWKKQLIEDAEILGKTVLTIEDYDNLLNMRKTALNYKYLRSLLENNTPEVSFFIKDWDVDGIGKFNVKIRPDILLTNILADYKTFKDSPVPNQFNRQVKIFHYDLSMALYHDVLKEFKDFRDIVLKCYWLVQNKTGTCDICLLDADEWLELGRAKYRKGLKIIKMYEEGEIVTSMDDIPQNLNAMPFSPSKWDLEEYGLY